MCGHSTTNKSAYMKYNIARPASMQTTPAIIEIVLRRQASELVGAADLNLVLHEAEQLRLRIPLPHQLEHLSKPLVVSLHATPDRLIQVRPPPPIPPRRTAPSPSRR